MRHNTLAVAFIVLAILIGHAIVAAPYSWMDNTISELGSQGYAHAWIMRIGFIGFGVLVTVGALQRIRTQRPLWYREIPLAVYGLVILLSGFFSAAPFVPGVAYSELEASLHSVMATLAGAGISLGILLYMLSDNPLRRKMAHLSALVLIVALSALFGMTTAGAGVVQRCLYIVGFAWLIYIEARPMPGQAGS
jgi:hypothetical membrane protein